MAAFLANLRAKALDETNSIPINAASKEMDDNRAYFTLVAKKMKKANKNVKGMHIPPHLLVLLLNNLDIAKRKLKRDLKFKNHCPPVATVILRSVTPLKTLLHCFTILHVRHINS